MTIKDFNKVVEDALRSTAELLTKKGLEYAEDAVGESDVDRLEHFKKVAMLTGMTTPQSVYSMMVKHIISISDMIKSGKDYPMDLWNEKISDNLNYLLILKAAIVEEKAQKENK